MGPRRHGERPAGRTRRRRRACPRRRPLPRRRLVSPPRRGGTHGLSTPPAVSVRLGDADDDLADVLTGEHGVEGAGRRLEALEYVAAVPQLPLGHPAAEDLCDLAPAAPAVPGDEALHASPAGYQAEVGGRTGGLVVVVVRGDGAAEHHPSVIGEAT